MCQIYEDRFLLEEGVCRWHMTDEKRNIAHWQSNLFHRRDRDRTGAVFPAHHVRTLASVFHQCCENDTVTFGSCGDRPDVVSVEVHYLLDSFRDLDSVEPALVVALVQCKDQCQ